MNLGLIEGPPAINCKLGGAGASKEVKGEGNEELTERTVPRCWHNGEELLLVDANVGIGDNKRLKVAERSRAYIIILSHSPSWRTS